MNYFKEISYEKLNLKKIKISLFLCGFLFNTTSSALPTNGTITSGNANINNTSNTTTITQTSNKASINWQSFNVAKNESVNFIQPNSSSITLNRIIGNEQSIIDGALNANGQVWILNSNGILFGKNASINTSGFLATTKNISDEDFQAGKYSFTGESSASIINKGNIKSIDSSYVILAANEVKNEGTIEAIKGTIHLVGADSISINLEGNSLVELKVEKSILDALAQNSGQIYADGGSVYLTTNAVDELLDSVVNNTGIIQANSLDDLKGSVELFAHGGEVQIGGTIEAKNGFVETSGKYFTSYDDAIINTNEWLIDPINITIDSSLASTISNALNTANVTITTDGSNTPDTSSKESGSDGDIFIASDIIYSGLTNRTLTLKAYRNIVFADSYIPSTYGSISSTNSALNIYLYSNTSNNVGAIWLPNGSSINSNGGNIILAGGNTGSINSVGVAGLSSSENNAIARGISLNGDINANGGDISIKGTGNSSLNARGVSIGGSVITNANGIITIYGTAAGSSDAIAIGDSSIASPSGYIQSENGDIYLYGTNNAGSSSSDSIYLNNSSYIQTTGTGDIALIGNGGNILSDSSSYIIGNSLFFTNAANIDLQSNLNNVNTLTTNSISGNLSYVDSDDITFSDYVFMPTFAYYMNVSASGNIDISTLNGDIINNVMVISNNGNVTLNAGMNSSAGDSLGGDIIGNSGVYAFNGRVVLYTGSIANSLVSNTVASGSGNFRYNSDESTTNYSLALGSTGSYVVYREQPIIYVSTNTQSVTYGDTTPLTSSYIANTSGYVNGDTNAILSGSAIFNYNTTSSSSGNDNAGSYDVVYTNGYTNALGYDIQDDTTSTNELVINKKDLTVNADDIAINVDENIPLFSYTVLGLITGDELSGELSSSATSNEVAGSYSITKGTLDNSNYNIIFTPATFTINSDNPIDYLDIQSQNLIENSTNIINSTSSNIVNENLNNILSQASLTNILSSSSQKNIASLPLSNGVTIPVVLQTSTNKDSTRVTLSQLKQALNQENVNIPISQNSILSVNNNGLNIPFGSMEQEFFIVNEE